MFFSLFNFALKTSAYGSLQLMTNKKVRMFLSNSICKHIFLGQASIAIFKTNKFVCLRIFMFYSNCLQQASRKIRERSYIQCILLLGIQLVRSYEWRRAQCCAHLLCTWQFSHSFIAVQRIVTVCTATKYIECSNVLLFCSAPVIIRCDEYSWMMTRVSFTIFSPRKTCAVLRLSDRNTKCMYSFIHFCFHLKYLSCRRVFFISFYLLHLLISNEIQVKLLSVLYFVLSTRQNSIFMFT